MNDGKHNLRFVSSEKRKRIQYATDKRREERGVKVVHLHTQITKRNWPSMELIGRAICDHYHKTGELCDVLFVAFVPTYATMCIPCHGLPDDGCQLTRDGARLVDVQVRYDERLSHGQFEISSQCRLSEAE